MHYSSRHIQYVHPRYILENDNVIIQGVTATHAFLCVTDTAVDVYDTKGGMQF
jgi:hypothetical protein